MSCSIPSSARARPAPSAKRLGRAFSASSATRLYAEAARARIAATEPLPPEAIAAAPSRRSEPRVAFSAIVEAGLIAPGATLFDEKRRHSALVRADGTIALGAVVGSIHKIGALAQGLPACNGWTYWHFLEAGKPAPIDALRAIARERLREAGA